MKGSSAWWLAIGLAALAGCSGGSDGAGSSGGAGGGGGVSSASGLANSGCTLRYDATPSALQSGTDPLLSSQWHLSNDGSITGKAGEDLRAFGAWASGRGEAARIVVIDNAIEVTHQDLEPNIVAGASYDYRAQSRGGIYPLPCLADQSHGTSVAGLAAARDGNATGGAGVAPRASLVGYNALATGSEADLIDAEGRGLDANSVYNNSWGAPDDGFLHPVPESFRSVIAQGIAQGRGGRGAIYVFPSGNGGCYLRSNGLCLGENANYDGYTNALGVIAACATDSDGRQPTYGERGANLLVCAPSSGSTTASMIRSTGLTDGYVSNFSGTSASTPMVSGVAALVLSARPDLTWRDVRLVLAHSARQNDPADADWVTANGLRFNHKYGFGVVDAQAAVALAKTWTTVGGSAALVNCGPYSAEVGRALPDPIGAALQPVSSTIDASGCAIRRIEFIEVRFTATHPSSGDLRLRLRSPAGLVSELADARVCQSNGGAQVDCGSYRDTPFGSVRHLDEAVVSNSAGWTLEVTDMASPDQGSFVRWSIRFYGR